jgi:SAM-dependent methyltransferase
VISSHVIEHFWVRIFCQPNLFFKDPIKTIEEWLRVVKPGGYVYMDIPHKERTFDKPRNRTTLSELLKRYNKPAEEGDRHWSVWITEDVLELARYFNWTVVEWSDQDDKTGVLWYPAIGFTVVLKKDK